MWKCPICGAELPPEEAAKHVLEKHREKTATVEVYTQFPADWSRLSDKELEEWADDVFVHTHSWVRGVLREGWGRAEARYKVEATKRYLDELERRGIISKPPFEVLMPDFGAWKDEQLKVYADNVFLDAQVAVKDAFTDPPRWRHGAWVVVAFLRHYLDELLKRGLI